MRPFYWVDANLVAKSIDANALWVGLMFGYLGALLTLLTILLVVKRVGELTRSQAV